MDPQVRLRLFAVLAVLVMAVNVWFLRTHQGVEEPLIRRAELGRASPEAALNLGDQWVRAVESGDAEGALALLALDQAADLALEGSVLASERLGEEQEILRAAQQALYDGDRALRDRGTGLRVIGVSEQEDGTWLQLGLLHANGSFDQRRWLVARVGDEVRVVDQGTLSDPPRLSARIRREVVDPQSDLGVLAFPPGAPQGYRAYLDAARAGDHEGAAAALESLGGLLPNDGFVLTAASSARLRAGQLERAREDADRAIDAEPELMDAHVQRLLVAAAQADEQAAGQELTWLGRERGLRPAIFEEDPAWAELRALDAYGAWSDEGVG